MTVNTELVSVCFPFESKDGGKDVKGVKVLSKSQFICKKKKRMFDQRNGKTKQNKTKQTISFTSRFFSVVFLKTEKTQTKRSKKQKKRG